jgi:outer membrane protein
VKAGLAAGLDLNRAASRRAQLDVQKASLSSEKRAAAVQLATVLGIEDEVELVDDVPNLDGAVDATDAEKLVSLALDARPELKAAELRGAAVAEERRSAASAFWPQVGAGALVQVGNNPTIAGAGNRAVAAAVVPFFGSSGDVQAGVTVSMNLFDTYSTTHAVEDAEHRMRLADEDLRALRRDVESGVRVAYARLVSLREQRVALQKAEAIEADDVTVLQHAYERGDVPLTELLDAQVALADAERQIVDFNAQLALALIELDAAVGAPAAAAAQNSQTEVKP